jgi:diguanylate cyclase (GGDEF)-like protein
MVLVVMGSAATAAWCLWQPHPLFGLLACAALAVPAVYAAVFHTSRLTLFTAVLAVAVGGLEATRLALAGKPLVAVIGYVVALELVVGIPFAVQTVVSGLLNDLIRADTDPLTGLLNRRAFIHAAVARLLARDRDAVLAMALIDLDRFKAVNDNHGHTVGDAALVAVARALDAASGETAVIGRMGGEEFILADVVDAMTSARWGERLRDAVAGIDYPVTASVGTVTAGLIGVEIATAEKELMRLVARADEAMYVAKRRGGDQACHCGPNGPADQASA